MARLPVITSFISERFSAFKRSIGLFIFSTIASIYQDKKQSLFVLLTVVVGYEY